MGFNYARERLKFDVRWKKLREEYRNAGMSEDAIQKMYDFDLDVFRQRRRHESRKQPLPTEEYGEDGKENRVDWFAKFDNLTVSFDESDLSGRYAWVESISNPNLTYRLKKLSQSDLELLTLFAIEGYSQSEIAQIHGCNQSAVSRKISRIKKHLINF